MIFSFFQTLILILPSILPLIAFSFDTLFSLILSASIFLLFRLEGECVRQLAGRSQKSFPIGTSKLYFVHGDSNEDQWMIFFYSWDILHPALLLKQIFRNLTCFNVYNLFKIEIYCVFSYQRHCILLMYSHYINGRMNNSLILRV